MCGKRQLDVSEYGVSTILNTDIRQVRTDYFRLAAEPLFRRVSIAKTTLLGRTIRFYDPKGVLFGKNRMHSSIGYLLPEVVESKLQALSRADWDRLGDYLYYNLNDYFSTKFDGNYIRNVRSALNLIKRKKVQYIIEWFSVVNTVIPKKKVLGKVSLKSTVFGLDFTGSVNVGGKPTVGKRPTLKRDTTVPIHFPIGFKEQHNAVARKILEPLVPEEISILVDNSLSNKEKWVKIHPLIRKPVCKCCKVCTFGREFVFPNGVRVECACCACCLLQSKDKPDNPILNQILGIPDEPEDTSFKGLFSGFADLPEKVKTPEKSEKNPFMDLFGEKSPIMPEKLATPTKLVSEETSVNPFLDLFGGMSSKSEEKSSEPEKPDMYLALMAKILHQRKDEPKNLGDPIPDDLKPFIKVNQDHDNHGEGSSVDLETVYKNVKIVKTSDK